jgi:hypothetical protein
MRRFIDSVTPPVLSSSSPGIAGLLEVRVARVENQRLAIRKFVVQHARDARVPAFSHARGLFGHGGFAGVVVEVEVLGADHLELKRSIGDLVAAEVLGLGAGAKKRHAEHKAQREENRRDRQTS